MTTETGTDRSRPQAWPETGALVGHFGSAIDFANQVAADTGIRQRVTARVSHDAIWGRDVWWHVRGAEATP